MTSKWQEGSVVPLYLTSVSTGSSPSFVVPNNVVYEVLWARVNIVADANTATRTIDLRIYDETGSNLVLVNEGNISIAASEAKSQNYAPGFTPDVARSGNDSRLPLPNKFLVPAKYKILFNVNSEQVGDVVTAQLLVIEHIIGEF